MLFLSSIWFMVLLCFCNCVLPFWHNKGYNNNNNCDSCLMSLNAPLGPTKERVGLHANVFGKRYDIAKCAAKLHFCKAK